MTDIYPNERDRTVFIEHYPDYTLISSWWDNGRLDYYILDHNKYA